MTSILSSISGQLGKSLILGAFLPATVFTIFWSVFFEPIYPVYQTFLEPLGLFSEEWLLVAVLFIIIVITGLLYNLNIPIIRLYEGYPWKDSSLGKRRIDHYKQDYRQVTARREGMRTLLRAMGKNTPDFFTIRRHWSAEGDRLLRSYPDRELLILPTRLGNVLRSFERYPSRQYNMDAIILWPRLVSKIDKEYLTVITDAKTSVDFMLNNSVLNGLLALSMIILGLVYPQDTLTTAPSLATWLIKFAAFTLLAYLFYLGAVSRAGAWGETVKSAFDLYRWDLLEDLGYQQKPQTRKAERDIWNKISIQMLYGDHPDRGPRTDYVYHSTSTPNAVCNDPENKLKVSRGVSQTQSKRVLTVVLEIKNPHKAEVVRDVVVTDHLPEGFDYIWGSGSIRNHPVQVEGTNPYVFHVGDLKPEETLRLRYKTVRRDVD
jgi:hypothetical protein